MIKKGEILELEIESLAYGGKGISRINDFVIFVKDSIPGQKVRALVYKKRGGFAEARPVVVLEESKDYTKPKCQHFDYCGGCTLQQLDYEKQILYKVQQVKDTYQRLAGIENARIDGVIRAEQIFNYRNKMEFTFSNHRWVLTDEEKDVKKDFALGLHIPGRYDKILDIHECHLQPAIGNEIINFVRDRTISFKLKPYDTKTHIGFLRHLVLRFGFNTNELMVNIVTSYENTDLLIPLVEEMVNKFPQITTVVNNINTRKADIALGEYEIILYGEALITEKLNDLNYEISANSFFQTNTIQAEKLYDAILKGAKLTGKEIVYDLYCGTGSIAIYLADKAKTVYGFDIIISAVEDAQQNALSNNIENVLFFKANLDSYFKNRSNLKELPSPDVIIVDPPRAGIHEDMVKFLPNFDANRIVYVSCNPTTQARDIRILISKNYKPINTIVVDMFPHTPHIETVTVLEK
jgi:23S rRNA (uracil1939-C5)-methyltransferase